MISYWKYSKQQSVLASTLLQDGPLMLYPSNLCLEVESQYFLVMRPCVAESLQQSWSFIDYTPRYENMTRGHAPSTFLRSRTASNRTRRGDVDDRSSKTTDDVDNVLMTYYKRLNESVFNRKAESRTWTDSRTFFLTNGQLASRPVNLGTFSSHAGFRVFVYICLQLRRITLILRWTINNRIIIRS